MLEERVGKQLPLPQKSRMEDRHLPCGMVICLLYWVGVDTGCVRNLRRLAEKWVVLVPCDRMQQPALPMRRATTAVGCCPPRLQQEMRNNRGSNNRRERVRHPQLLSPIPCFGQKGKKCRMTPYLHLIARLYRKAFQRYFCFRALVLFIPFH